MKMVTIPGFLLDLRERDSIMLFDVNGGYRNFYLNRTCGITLRSATMVDTIAVFPCRLGGVYLPGGS